MVTTIQINDHTLQILKKLKEEINASSYDEAINKMVTRKKKKSLAGSIGKEVGKKTKMEILKNLREKNERF